MECCGENFSKVKTDDTHHFSTVLEIAFQKAIREARGILPSVNPYFLSHHLLIPGSRKVFKENLIYGFPRNQNEAGYLVVKPQKNQNPSTLLRIKKKN